MKKKIAATLGIIGFIIILGAAGSEELNSITFAQSVYQALFGVACMLVACFMCRNETF